jgi:2-haloacid dehalogenase
MTSDPKALVFDVFGTVVDWRSTIVREGEELGRTKNLDVDWAAFADAWRSRYAPSMNRVRRGEIAWTNLDALHRASLEELLREFGIEGLTEEERDHLNRVWHRLNPWPDAVEGLTCLRSRHVIAPLSNGNVALLVNMAKRAGLPWDLILSSELVRHYKPDPETYLSAPELLDLRPGQVMMVAAHTRPTCRPEARPEDRLRPPPPGVRSREERRSPRPVLRPRRGRFYRAGGEARRVK